MTENVLDQARSLFFAEAREMCEQIEAALLKLEQDPADRETLNAMFRAAHTIKGSAGMFGLMPVVGFTHKVESVLDRLREGVFLLDINLTSLMFECGDHIRALLEQCEHGGDDPVETPEIAQLSKWLGERLDLYMGKAAESVEGEGTARSDAESAVLPPVAGVTGTSGNHDDWLVSVRFGEDTFRDGFDPFSVIGYLSTLGNVKATRIFADAVPSIGALNPESCHLEFEILIAGPRSKDDIEAAFDLVKECCTLRILPPERKLSEVIALIDSAGDGGAQLGEILVGCGALTKEELRQGLAEQAERAVAGMRPPLGEVLVEKGLAPAATVNAALHKQTKTRETRSEEARYVRVRADKLDDLINLVGELVIASAGTTIQARQANNSPLIESTLSMGRLIEEIRNGALSLRMVPIGETFARFKRVVRDVAAELSKEVALELSGAETELDKSVVEHIGDPLMHLVRNALDHGMETPAEREAAGKPRCGTVHLSACHDSGGILIRIADDGRGIRRDKVLAKAIEKGLVAAGATLADSEIDNLIFEAGFSTADQVTNLSGRGVGMDVVRRNIEGLRGTVGIRSMTGRGTTVEIRLPLTLAIIDGFLVRVGDCSFVIPLDRVIECMDGAPAIAGASGATTGMMVLRDAALPVVHVSRMFGLRGQSSARQSVVVVKNGAEKAGLVVDHLLGEFQTVIKPLGKMFRNVRGIAGSTILGSGEVGLILDIASLTGLARMQMESGHAEAAEMLVQQEVT
jgi:two-component system chemotaxis sensor kinase CheA